MTNIFDHYLELIKPYIEKKAVTCSYCDYLEDLVLLKGKYTYVTIAIWQFVEWYVQLCPIKHRTTAWCLKWEELKEFIMMQKIIKEAYEKCYGTPGIAFEHGKAWSCMRDESEIVKNSNSLCHHAHRHFLPVDINIRDDIKEYVPREVIVTSLDELNRYRDVVLEWAPYLYFEDSKKIWYIYPVNDDIIPRQFLRTCVAKALWMSERADWIKYPWVEFYESTKEKLKPVLESILKNYQE